MKFSTWMNTSQLQVGFCASKCMENEVGTQILKLIVVNTFIGSILDIGCGILFGVLLHVSFSLCHIQFSIMNIYPIMFFFSLWKSGCSFVNASNSYSICGFGWVDRARVVYSRFCDWHNIFTSSCVDGVTFQPNGCNSWSTMPFANFLLKEGKNFKCMMSIYFT